MIIEKCLLTNKKTGISVGLKKTSIQENMDLIMQEKLKIMTELKYRVAEYKTVYQTRETNAVKITSSKDTADFARSVWPDDLRVREIFMIFTLNRANNIFGYEVISTGTLIGTVIDVKKIGKSILDTMASGVLLAHNHPSGRLYPSDADRSITEKIKSMTEILDCNLLDHVIIFGSDHYSFADEGLMQ